MTDGDAPEPAARVRVVTRPPAPSFSTGCELTFVERRPVDFAVALEQHRLYRDALTGAGCSVTCLPPLEAHPDGTFVEDVALVLPEVAVLCRPGAPSRRGEVEAVEAALPGDRPLHRIPAPATLEGGDVLRLGRRLVVGRSTRTNQAGVAALARIVERHGYEVTEVEVGGALHLQTVCTALDDRTVLVDPSRFDPGLLDGAGSGTEVIEVDPAEPDGANVLRAGDAVIASASWPLTVARLRASGRDVRTVPLGEFEKAEGGATCLGLIVP